ncbi:hypothetical protein MMC11_004020 [Xylographa trunciseda]|nr:hypothetical protein [Xylographa trunciseda]
MSADFKSKAAVKPSKSTIPRSLYGTSFVYYSGTTIVWGWRNHCQSTKQSLETLLEGLKKIQQHNVRTFREQPLQEMSGAFGDLGTLMPLFLGLAQNGSISISSTLVFMGLSNIITGVYFGIPLPVQPMKAIAAVAIAGKYTPPQLASAGLFVAAFVGFLSVTRLVQWFTKRIPLPIVKGIQVGTGLSLIISAGSHIPLDLSSHPSTHLVLVVTLLFLLVCSIFRKVPFVLCIVILCVPSVFLGNHGFYPHLSIWNPSMSIPSLSDFRFGAINAGLGQVPLTTLNSVVAVTYLATELIPEVPETSATAIGCSVSLMNLVGCWFSAMPLCHGSGGLASQYRFGARSGASIIFLGLIKLLLGLFASEYALVYSRNFWPVPLGVLLFLAGVELAKMGESLNTEGARDLWEKTDEAEDEADLDEPGSTKRRTLTSEERMRRWTTMIATVGAILAFKNDGVGFIVGLLLHGTYELLGRIQIWRAGRQGTIRLPDDRMNESHE